MFVLFVVGRFTVHKSIAFDDNSRRPSVPECPQDVQQHTTVSACLNSDQRLVYWSGFRSSGQ